MEQNKITRYLQNSATEKRDVKGVSMVYVEDIFETDPHIIISLKLICVFNPRSEHLYIIDGIDTFV